MLKSYFKNLGADLRAEAATTSNSGDGGILGSTPDLLLYNFSFYFRSLVWLGFHRKRDIRIYA